jgi:hypothetical protein
MSEDVAYKRICAARAARRFPAIFAAVADGSLHVSTVVMLAPHLAPDTAHDLLATAAHKSKAAIEHLLAERFPKPDLPTVIQAIAPAIAADIPALQRVDVPDLQLAPGRVVPTPGPNLPAPIMPLAQPLSARARPVPLSPGRHAVQFTMDEGMYEDLLAVQALLGHVLPSGDLVEVLRRALRELRQQLENRKFAKCDRPRPQRGPAKARHTPAAVRRAVFERDRGQCTFMGENGKRCGSRTRLEYDHVQPVARGGQATIGGIRLRCRAHNQYAADCAFGLAFMNGKREQGREQATHARAQQRAQTMPEAPA